MFGVFCVFKYNAVVSRLNMTVRDADIAAVVWVYAVAVGQLQIVQNADPVYQHIAAADQMGGPEGAAGESHLMQRQMADIFKEQQRHPGIKGPVNMPGSYGSVKNFFVAVDFAETCYRDIFTVPGV